MDRTPDLYLLDTNILLHAVRRSPVWLHVEQTYRFQSRGENPLVSVVTEGELRSLALQFGWGEGRLRRMEHLLEEALIVPLDYQGLIDSYAQIDAYCRKAGTPIGENDTWIAATASATGATLLTTDRDFRHLDPDFISHDWIDPAVRPAEPPAGGSGSGAR